MDTVSKICLICKTEKPLSEFYFRQGKPQSYCKICMRANAKIHPPKDKRIPKDETEIIAAEYLESKGIPVLPGKALQYSHVDIVAFGCVRIEVKYSTLFHHKHYDAFKWSITPTQKQGGLRADLVMLICDYQTRMTYHFFPVAFPAFYINGTLKTGFTFTPGAMKTRKFGATRVVMTQPMMDLAQDRVMLIHEQLSTYCEALKSKYTLQAAA